MSDIIQETTFLKFGMDSDTDLRYVEVGSAPEHYNVLIGEDGDNGTLTNMKGNKRIPLPTNIELNLSYVYLTVGSYYNELTRSIYYFIFSLPYDSDGSGEYLYDNYLLRYNEDDEDIDLIFHDQHNYFGLHKDYLMRDCRMIGDWLYFNPKISEPKMIDVEMAYNYSNYDAYDATLTYSYGDSATYYGGLFSALGDVALGETPVTNPELWDRIGNAYQDETGLSFDSEFRYAFNVIKQPPVNRPSFSYGSDADVYSNNVRNRMFRFAYRYKYFDNSYSVYSALSDVSLSVDDEVWNGEIAGDTTTNNYILVTVGLHSAALIKEAEIIFQEIGETGHDWKRCKIINRREQAEITNNTFTYNFYNNESYPVVDNDKVALIYDYVPRTAQTTEIIHKNILLYGQCLEGFDNLDKEDIDVSLTPEMESLEINYEVDTLRVDHVADGYITTYHESTDYFEISHYYTYINVSGWYAAAGLQTGDMYNVVVNGYAWSTSLSAVDVANAENVAKAMAASILNFSATAEEVAGSWRVKLEHPFAYPLVTVSRIYKPTTTLAELSKYTGHKTGAFHPYCIFYYDENLRRWDAQTSKESIHGTGYEWLGTTVYIPMFNEVSPTSDTANRWVVNWTVDHLPPDGAKYWRWGYAGNSLCSYFVQYIIGGIASNDDKAEIDITPLQTIDNTTEAGWNSFPHSVIDPYIWEKGDRVRFITVTADPDVDKELGAVIDGIHDYEIIGQSDDGYTIYTQDFGHALAGIGENSLIEIYRPRKDVVDTHLVFYEFGDLMPIIIDADGVYVHGGQTTNQDTSTDTAASGTFDYGDVYHILRTPSKPLSTIDNEVSAFHESMSYSDFYDSGDWSKGKEGEETSFNERELNIIRFSLPYLQNTQINGLSTFYGSNYKELNDTYGEIMGMEEVGDTVKVYQERKPSSIQLGRIERTDETGSVFISAISDVLGSIRYSTTRWGTEFRESIIKNNRYVYGFDIYNGVMWRDSANGIFPISGRYMSAEGGVDYRMSTYFKNKAKALLDSGVENVDVFTMWDEEYDLLYVTFRDYVTESNDATVVFHEPTNRWLCLMEHDKTETYNRMLELTYSVVYGFSGGIGYSFNEDDRFAYFDIQTGADILRVLGYIDLDIIILAPTVSCAASKSPDLLDLEIEVQAPTAHVSYVHSSDYDLEFAGTDEDSTTAQSIDITNTESDVTITDHSGIVQIARDSGGSVGATISTGASVDNETLWLYMLTQNYSSSPLTGYVELTDGYGNVCTINVTQAIQVTSVAVSLEVDSSSTALLSISDDSGFGIVGNTRLSLTFTPDHTNYSYGENIDLTYYILKNGVHVGSGYWMVADGVSTNKRVYMTSAAADGDTVIVYLETT